MVSKTPPQPLKTTGMGSVVEPDVLTRDAARMNRKITKADIQGLYNYAVNIRKEPINSFVVIVDNRGNFKLRKAGQKIPSNEKLVGDLGGLYGKYVKPPRTIDPAADNFAKKVKQKTAQELQTQEVKENINKFPVERKTFFK